MFGNLFDDDGGGGATDYAEGGNRIPPAPPPRNRTGLAGIWNQGSTCFLNTALQVLAFTPEFRGLLFVFPLLPAYLSVNVPSGWPHIDLSNLKHTQR